MKACPVCHETYSDATTFCTRDGTALVAQAAPTAAPAAAPSATWPASAVAAVAASVTAAVLLVAFLVMDRRQAPADPAPAATPTAPLHPSVAAPAPPPERGAPSPRPEPPPAEPAYRADTPAAEYALPASSPGDWLVIFGSFTEYQNADLEARLRTLENQGMPAVVGSSADYPNLVPGFRIVFVGPYTQPAAKRVSDDMKPVIPEVYYKSGW